MTNRTTEKQWRRGQHAARHWGIIAAIVAGLALAAGCSDDPPVKPEPVHYNIYAAANAWPFEGKPNSRVYVYDADSLTLLDSIPLPHLNVWADASPDGRFLYVVLWRYNDPPYGRYIEKIDVSTREVVWSFETGHEPRNMPTSLLDDGRLLQYGRLLIDTETGAVASHLDFLAENHWVLEHGPREGTEVAVFHYDSLLRHDYSDTLVMAVDLLTASARGGFVARSAPGRYPMSVYYARLHQDGHHVLLHGEDGAGAWFVVGNIESGEQLLLAGLSTSYGETGISEDGKLAVVVDKGNMFFGYGDPAVHVYDLVNWEHPKTFHDELRSLPGQVRFLPGDRRIAVQAPVDTYTGVGWLQIFDLNTFTREYVVDHPFNEPHPGGIAIAPRPEQ